MEIRKQEINRKLDELYCRVYGGDKEFNDKMCYYQPSSFCAGFVYAIGLVKGWLTLLPKDTESLRKKGEWINARMLVGGFAEEWGCDCSRCGISIKEGYRLPNFCPNCGCDMRQMEDGE